SVAPIRKMGLLESMMSLRDTEQLGKSESARPISTHSRPRSSTALQRARVEALAQFLSRRSFFVLDAAGFRDLRDHVGLSKSQSEAALCDLEIMGRLRLEPSACGTVHVIPIRREVTKV